MEQQETQKTGQQKNLLEDVFDTAAYERKIRSAENTIYIVAVVQLLAGVVVIYLSAAERRLLMGFVFGGVAVFFFAMALLCKRYPFTAILITLIFYVLLVTVDVIENPSALISGGIIKLIIIVYLVKGLLAARQAAKMKKMFNSNE
ncbi:hypothetical protein [Foetidibacter luteolus]|uniref:hypothetical protein n=1 Tax=Foetidibacter luteolus TaxID=2608880 RepID=UPI00129A900A|nr:hypothetical protein [Foetidibacter luteolus]